jgi:hypothetical protein
MAKKSTSAVDLKQQLESALPDAESAVVESAVEFVADGKDANALKESVNSLNAIRAAIFAMEKVTKKSNRPAVEPAAKAAN